jgi:hypothetical protein
MGGGCNRRGGGRVGRIAGVGVKNAEAMRCRRDDSKREEGKPDTNWQRLSMGGIYIRETSTFFFF